jgi:hypothetical protein
MNPIDVHLSSSRSSSVKKDQPEKNISKLDPVDKLLVSQIENMKKSMESIKFKSFID